MNKEYIFYIKDESFDYNTPMGTATFGQYSKHGFEVDININGKIDISTLRGFGDFEEMNAINTFEELETYLTCNLDIVENQYLEDMKNLIEIVRKNNEM